MANMPFTDDITDDILAVVPEFRSIANCSRDAALFYLRAMGGNLSRALDYFFGSDGTAHLLDSGIPADHGLNPEPQQPVIISSTPSPAVRLPQAAAPDPAPTHVRSPRTHHRRDDPTRVVDNVHGNEEDEEHQPPQRQMRGKKGAAQGGATQKGHSIKQKPAAAAVAEQPPDEIVQRQDVDMDDLKLDLRHIIEAAMIKIRSKRQSRLDLERAGSYILHSRAIRDLLATLEQPLWGSAEDFLTVFPEEHVRAHGKKFLRMYREFRHERLGDVCASLTNKELRQIQDAAAAYRIKRRRLQGRGSSSSSSSTEDDECSDSADATDDDEAALPQKGGIVLAKGKTAAAKPTTIERRPSLKNGKKAPAAAAINAHPAREASISPIGSDDSSSDASLPDSDSDSPKQLRRRSTGSAATALRRNSKLGEAVKAEATPSSVVKTEVVEAPVEPATPGIADEMPPTRMRLSFGGPVDQGQEVRPKRGRTESVRHLSHAQVLEYTRREYDNFRRVKDLKAYGEFREAYASTLRGEVKYRDPTPLVTFPLRFHCIPIHIFALLDLTQPKQLLAALRLSCSCCDTSPILKQYFSDELVQLLLSERIAFPSSIIRLLPDIPRVAAYRLRKAIPACDCEDHRKLAEIISCVEYFTRHGKKQVHRSMNVTLQRKGAHEFAVTLHLASIRPRTLEVEVKLRRMVAINNIMEFIAERSHDRSIAARLQAYPVIPNDAIHPLIREVEALGSHTKLLTAASICHYDEDKPLPVAATPQHIAIDLKRHQRESLAFALDKERAGTKDMIDVPVPLCPGVTLLYNPITQCVRFFLKDATESIDAVNPVVRGGFLCDEMGLGKTAVILSLVAANPVVRAIDPKERARLPLLARWSFVAVEPFVPDAKSLVGSDDEDDFVGRVCDLSTRSGASASAAAPVAPAPETTHFGAPDLKPPPGLVKGAKVCQGTPCIRNPHAEAIAATPLLGNIVQSSYYKQRHELIPIRATLIVVPVSICGQWTLEIKKCAPTLKYLVFHGVERHHFTIEDLQKVDIILTTYETLSAQMRREGEHSLMASFAGRPDAATCGPCVSEILHKALKQARENHAQYLETIKQLAIQRPEDVSWLKGFVDFKNSPMLISRIRFHRVVFDESQKCAGGALDLVIEDLQATHRWVVTGTPVNQSLTSVGKLFKAIGCRAHHTPFDIASFFDKSFLRDQSWISSFSSPCGEHVFNLVNAYASAPPAGMTPFADDFLNDLADACDQFESNYYDAMGYRDSYAFSTSNACKQHHWALLHMLRWYMVRHEKNASILADITLPARYEVGVPVVLSADEMFLYNTAATKVRESFLVLSRQERIGNRMSRVMMWVDMLQRAALSNTLVSEDRMSTDTQGTVNENTKHNFTPIEPMALLEKLSRMDGIPTSATDTLAKMCEVPPEVDDCAVCMCGMVQPTMLRCNHFYCRECVLQVISTAQAEPMCPTCRKTSPNKEKYVIQLAAEVVPQENVEQIQAVKRRIAAAGCSKIKAIIDLIQGVWRNDPTSRFVIFSRFPSFLRMLESRLCVSRIAHIVVDGSTTLKKRASLIEDFQRPDSATRVCMVSSRAGNAGLTLTAANHLILVEPGLNESVELQAAARIHRFGQLRPVTIHKMYSKGTIEEQIFEMASRKELAGQGANQDGANASVEQAKRLLS